MKYSKNVKGKANGQQHIINSLKGAGVCLLENKVDFKKENSSYALGKSRKVRVVKLFN